MISVCEQEGPAENAGENVDNMMADMPKSLEKGGVKMVDMVERGDEEIVFSNCPARMDILAGFLEILAVSFHNCRPIN